MFVINAIDVFPLLIWSCWSISQLNWICARCAFEAQMQKLEKNRILWRLSTSIENSTSYTTERGKLWSWTRLGLTSYDLCVCSLVKWMKERKRERSKLNSTPRSKWIKTNATLVLLHSADFLSSVWLLDLPARQFNFQMMTKIKPVWSSAKTPPMATYPSSHTSVVDSVWKERIERALKQICRTIDIRQRRDAA